ncbi:12325_t:CDS:2, partial [Acaulospora morrowiae]
MTNSVEELFSKEAFGMSKSFIIYTSFTVILIVFTFTFTNFSEYFIERKSNERKELDFLKWLNEKKYKLKLSDLSVRAFLEQAITNDQDQLKSFAKIALMSINYQRKNLALMEVQAQDISIATRYRDMASSILDSRLEHAVNVTEQALMEVQPHVTEAWLAPYWIAVLSIQPLYKFFTKIPSNVSEWWEHVTIQMELKNIKKFEKLVMAKDSISNRVDSKLVTVGQLIGIGLLDKGLYFGFDGPAFRFSAQICSISVLRQTLEVFYYFK